MMTANARQTASTSLLDRCSRPRRACADLVVGPRAAFSTAAPRFDRRRPASAPAAPHHLRVCLLELTRRWSRERAAVRSSAADLFVRATIKSSLDACAVPTALQRSDCRHRERLLLLLRSSPQADHERRLRASAAPRASRRFGRMSALLAHANLADDRARPAAAPCVRRRGKWRRRVKLGGVCCERRSSLSLLVADSLPV